MPIGGHALMLKPAIPIASDASAQLYLNAAYTAGSRMSQAWANAYNALVVGLKADGVWTLTENLWIWGGPDAFAGLIDVRRLITASPVAAPTFTAKAGYAFNGTTQYINTTRVPSTDFSVATEDSLAIGVWCLSNVQAAQIDLAAGGAGSPSEIQINSLSAANTQNGRLCTTSGQVYASMPVSTSVGFAMQSRTADNVSTAYKDGAAHGSVSTTASTALPIVSIFAGAKNSDGSPIGFSTRSQYAAGVWAGLDATQALAVYTRLDTFKTATAGL
jgi:hypothetical protein